MFDIFYIGNKAPGISPLERPVSSIQEAQQLSRTRYCWITHYLCDYSNWDFLYEPPPWEQNFVHAWASQHQKDCETYLVPKYSNEGTKYHPEVINRTTGFDCWSNSNDMSFDYSWHPDPSEPPYIYQFGTQWQKTGGPTYTVPGATEVKYVSEPRVITRDIHPSCWEFPHDTGTVTLDLTWHPDDTIQPYIYQFGTQWQKTGGPQYVVPGATEVKYVSAPRHIANKVDMTKWENTKHIDEFDYTWHPDFDDPTPYIYQFGTQWQKSGGPRYVTPGATEVKYVSEPRACTTNIDMSKWTVPDGIEDFDYTWHPDDTEVPYIYQFGTQWQKSGGPTYTMPGATEVKYVTEPRVKMCAVDMTKWENTDEFPEFDYTWHPDDTEVPYIYQFGTQWQKTSGPRYVMPGATEVKYVTEPRAESKRINEYWTTPEGIEQFDYTWHPDETEVPYIYQFGTQWQKTGGPTYTVPGATEVKYVSEPRSVITTVNESMWETPDGVEHFDYTWHPDASDDTPYIYQFGTQWQKTGGPRYVMPGATEVKYVSEPRAYTNIVNAEKWETPDGIEYFDYTWHPDASDDTPYIYQFGTQWQKTNGPRYVMPGATEVKYVSEPRARISTVDMSLWQVPDSVGDFDYTWHPDSSDPQPYIYQFGTQWQKTGGPRYVMPGATEVKYVSEPRAKRTMVNMSNWETPSNIDNFDYTWHPDETDTTPYIYQFGTQWQKTGGPRYVMPGATEVKYVSEPRAFTVEESNAWEIPDGVEFDNFDYTWHPDNTETPYIYQFGTQWQKTGGPRFIMEGATEVKYVSSPRAIRTTVDDNWVAPTVGEFADFDYTWHPDETDGTPYIYQFGTQWQKTGGPQYIMLNATEVKYVDQVKITAKKVTGTAIIIDFFDGHAKEVEAQLVKHGLTVVKTSRYYNDYLGTIRRVVRNVEADYVWIVSSICDYTNFDFSWHPEQWQAGMIHVFPSNEQKFGDTFLVNVQHFNDTTNRYELLEWHDAHFVENIRVKRRTAPQIAHTSDSHVEVIQTSTFSGPVAVFTNNPQEMEIPTINLWREETKQVVPLTPGGTTVVVPNVAIPYIKTQVYDYPEIDKTHRHDYTDKPLDIVFISNGETVAEENWNHLLEATQHLPNKVYRVDGVKGRVNSFNAAWAQTSSEWVFHVTAKLQVNRAFDWNWQPDRLQQPKHYIFHAHNPVNGLEYGHMAMVAYNVNLGKQNDAHGLDFTTNQLHEVVPLMSGVANYVSDPLVAWRTAFREVVKLKDALSTPETDYRLEQWLSTDLINNVCSAWSLQGARDAVEYYDSVQGRFEALRLTYEWDWLASYLLDKHGITEQELIKKAL